MCVCVLCHFHTRCTHAHTHTHTHTHTNTYTHTHIHTCHYVNVPALSRIQSTRDMRACQSEYLSHTGTRRSDRSECASLPHTCAHIRDACHHSHTRLPHTFTHTHLYTRLSHTFTRDVTYVSVRVHTCVCVTYARRCARHICL